MPTTQCTSWSLDFHPRKRIDVRCDAPDTSSDGGWLLVRQADENLGLSERFATVLGDSRDPKKVQHSRLEQIRQRVYQIAAGYEDANDADTLRHDKLLRTVCDQIPDDTGALSSQPTLSRLENTVGGRTLRQLQNALEDAYVARLPGDTTELILDIDSTDDPTHGQQQLSFFHGYYRHHMLHPLLVFDAEGQLVSMLLRPGNTHSSRGATPLLQRLILKLKQRFPHLHILVRGDSGFCIPALLETLEALDHQYGDVDYLFGIAKNARLLDATQEIRSMAAKDCEERGTKVRWFSDLTYAAKSWSRQRRVLIKAEHMPQGANPRFVVTSLNDFDSQLLYDRGYCARGQCENHIKAFKRALQADRLSCHRFAANAFRLMLHAAAYRLLFEIRCVAKAHDLPAARWQFDTLRLVLLKVASRVQRSARRILVQLPRAFPKAHMFYTLSIALANPAPG